MAETPESPDWFKLDNAAKIYPPAYSDHAPEVFSVGLAFNMPVRYHALSRALERTINRFPYYQVHLRRGLFWYYLQKHQTAPVLEVLGDSPVSRIRMRSRTEQLFRVFVRGCRVRIDFSHVLTDATGAFRFLSTMSAEYLRQRGLHVPKGGLVMDIDRRPDAGEITDAYPEMLVKGTPKPDPLGPAYHIPGPAVPGYYRTLTGRVPVDKLVMVARGNGASITEYLVAVYVQAILEIWKKSHPTSRKRRVIRLEVPADMRRVHPSRTMRNFSLFVSPEIDLRLGDLSFSDIVKTIHHSMRLQLDKRTLRRQIARNVGGENLTIVRLVPLFLKDRYLSSVHHRLGANVYSGVLSNLGAVEFPETMKEHIDNVSFVLGPNPTLRKTVSVIGYNGSVNVSIGSVVESRELERIFFRQLITQGVPVRLSEQES